MMDLSRNPSHTSPTALSPSFYLDGGASGRPVPPSAIASQGQGATEGEGGENKRRRIARACDMCRKKKIKCDGKLPACTHCVNYKTECQFTLVEKKRNPPKGAKYIEGLENRLGRMETLLKLSGLLPEGDDRTDLGDLERRLQESAVPSRRGASNDRSSSESARNTPASSAFQSASNSPKNSKNEEEAEALSDQMCSLVTNDSGETRFIGSSSGFSIFSPRGIQWVNEKTGDDSFQRMMADAALKGCKGNLPNGDTIDGLFGRRGKNPLPPKDIAYKLITAYFGDFNVLFPLFHKATFEKLFERQYSNNSPKDSGWYAAFNIVLAIACRLRISHTPDSLEHVPVKDQVAEAWTYFENSTSVLTELLLKNTDLLSIQAILGMALFLQGTANPQPSFFLIAAAVRIATSIGMHRRGSAFGLSEFEVEQRRRIWWILYLLDKDTALRSGRPPCINDDDCSVELPEENPPDGIGDIYLKQEKGRKFNLFRTMARFGVIEGQVYMRLYSAKAAKQTDGELLNTIGQLDHALEEWKDSVPAEFRPENEMFIQHQGAVVMHVVFLHYAYYNCLTTIHRMSIHHGYWTSRLSNYAIAGLNVRPLNPRIFSSAALCVSAARATVHLIKYLDPKDYPCIWLIMYYPVSALVTLFANILQNPQDLRARADIKLMEAVVDFLENVLAVDDRTDGALRYEDGSINRMLVVCGEFVRVASVVLDKSEKEGGSRRKRKLPDSVRQEPKLKSFGASAQLSGSPTAPANTPAPNTGVTVAALPTPATGTEASSPRSFQPLGGFSPAMDPMSWFNDVESPNGPSPLTPPLTVDGIHNIPMVSANSFEQPFVPQDLWQMPMTFEWDWADVGGSTPWTDNLNNNV